MVFPVRREIRGDWRSPSEPGSLALPTIAGPDAGPRAFDTPQQAADALVKAAETDDVPALLAMMGPEGKDIISSGDPVEDKNHLAKFAKKAREKMKVSFDVADPKRAILVAGDDDWPMPVPIVETGGKWRFDAKQGREEILARRIGGNELDAITLLRGYVDAQKEYASQLRDGATLHQYAQKWISTPGKQDGLSWTRPRWQACRADRRRDREAAGRGLHEESRTRQRLLLPHADGPGPERAARAPATTSSTA